MYRWNSNVLHCVKMFAEHRKYIVWLTFRRNNNHTWFRGRNADWWLSGEKVPFKMSWHYQNVCRVYAHCSLFRTLPACNLCQRSGGWTGPAIQSWVRTCSVTSFQLTEMSWILTGHSALQNCFIHFVCIFVFVCFRVLFVRLFFVRFCMCLRAYVRVSVCMRACVCLCACLLACVRTCVSVRVSVLSVCACVRACVYVRVCFIDYMYAIK